MKAQIRLAVFFSFLGLIFSADIYAQDWAQTISSHIINNWVGVSDIDNSNNIYCYTHYPDSLFIDDTSFVHSGHKEYPDNAAIIIYSETGEFLKAYDFHTVPGNEIRDFFLQTDEEENMYVACEFRRRIFIQDTVINHGPGPSVRSTDIAIIKIGNDGEVSWGKVICSMNQEALHGFVKTSDNNFYVLFKHYYSGTAYYMEQDTIEFEDEPSVLIKFSKDGEIIWRKTIKRIENGDIRCRNLFVDENNDVFVAGYTRGGFMVDGDTIYQPDNYISDTPNFIIGFDENGQKKSAVIADCDLSFSRIISAPDGDLFFSARLYPGSSLFGQDTLSITEDSTLKILGRMNKSFEPVWYHQVRTRSWYLSSYFSIGFKRDTLYAAIQGTRVQTVAGIEYDMGFNKSTLLVPFSEDGTSGLGSVLKARYQRYPSNLLVDHCDNLLMGGGFRGEGWFGKDTITSNSTLYSDGFISKFYFGKNDTLYIGNDTTISISSTITLTASDGFDAYEWSNGTNGQSTSIDGYDIGLGNHVVWCEASNGNCYTTDTLLLQVVSETSIEENKKFDLTIYPNPFSEYTIIRYELSCPTQIQIAIFNHLGKQIEFIQQYQLAGKQHVSWDASSQPSGVYYFRMQAGEQLSSGKMVVVR